MRIYSQFVEDDAERGRNEWARADLIKRDVREWVAKQDIASNIPTMKRDTPGTCLYQIVA